MSWFITNPVSAAKSDTPQPHPRQPPNNTHLTHQPPPARTRDSHLRPPDHRTSSNASVLVAEDRGSARSRCPNAVSFCAPPSRRFG
jgi:hypothetical protein